MPQPDLDQRIRGLVDDFVSDLTELVRRTALESVEAALAGMEPEPRGGSRRPRARRAPTGSASPEAAARPTRRAAAAERAALGEELLAQLAASPGQRAEELQAALGAEPAAVSRALRELRDAGRVATSGRARGTTYSLALERPEELREIELVPLSGETLEPELGPAERAAR